jgi:preprotein translocase subunit SecD
VSKIRYRAGVVAVVLVAVLGLTVVAAPALGSDDGNNNTDAASFTIDAVDVPAEGEAGEQITVTADITNTGDAKDQTTVSVDIGESSAETSLTLGAGASETVTLDVSLPEDRGDYDWTLQAGDDQESGTIGVLGPEIVLNEVIVPSEAEPGEVVAFDMDITNKGELDGSVDISVDFDDSEIDSGTVEFAAGENSIVFVEEAMPEEPGTYDWTVTVGDQTQSGTIEVVGPEFVVDAVYGPETLEAGDSVVLDLEITNQGPVAGEQDVSLEIAGEEVFAGTYSLYAGETGVVTADVVLPAEPGTYELVATAGEDTYTTEIDVVGPEFVINDVSGPGSAAPGETVTFEIDVTNEGDLAGSEEIAFEFGGEEVGSNVFEFGAGENSVIEAEAVMPEEPGTYDWTASAGGDTYTGETTIEGTEPAAFALDSVSVPASGDAGETVTVEATVSNTGDKTGETTVTFDLGSQQYDTTVSLDGGDSQTVSFDATLPGEGGTYDWTMAAGDASETGSIDVTAKEDDPAAFSLGNVVAPASGDAGETVTVETTVSNTGDKSGETTVTFDLGGQQYDTTVSLDGGDSQTVSFDASLPDEGGTYDWTMAADGAEQTGSIDVAAEEDDPAEFSLDDVSVPSAGDAGAAVTVEATVWNTGEESGETAVTFDIGGQQYDTTVSLDGGDSQTVTLEATLPEEGGDYDWTMTAGGTTETGTVDVATDDPAAFSLDSVSVPSSGDAGEAVAVEATVSNTGEESGETTVTFDIGGQQYDTTVSLDGGDSQTVTLDATLPDEGGDYDWTVAAGDDTDSGTLRVDEEDEPATFAFDSISVPSAGDTGEQVTVEATVSNTGDQAGDTAVEFSLGGDTYETTVSLDGGDTERVTLDATLPDDDGDYDWALSTDDDTEIGSVEVGDGAGADSPEFVIDAVEQPAAVTTGDQFTVEATLVNEGSAGEDVVRFVFAGETVSNETVSLDAGEQTTLEFEPVAPEQEGPTPWMLKAGAKRDSGELAVENEPAAFEVESVDLPDEGVAGEFVSVDVEIKNVGEEKATKAVALQLDGTNVSTDDLTLPGRDTKTVSFDLSLPDEGGTYDVDVVAGGDSVSETIEVTGTDPEYVIDGVDAPNAAELGESVTITPGITNEGGEAGNFRLELTVAGEVVETKQVSLDNGESITPTFDVNVPDEEGTYDWTIAIDGTEESGTIEVQQSVDTARLSLEEATVETDETTSIALTASAQNLASYDISISFDPDVVSVVEVSDGDIDGVSPEIDNENGVLELSAAQESGVDDPVLATIEFTTATTDDGTTDLMFGNSPAVFSGETETFDVETESGAITVESTVQCEPGDVNGDGEMTIADATLIQQYVVDAETSEAFEPQCGDLTGDGKITTADVIAAMNQLAEIEG